MLDRIHKSAESVAAFAIVGSLVFVGIQMQQNTSALKSTAAQSSLANWQGATLTVATNDILIDTITIAGHQPSADWSPQDHYRLLSYTTSSMKAMERHYMRRLEGNLSDEVWAATRRGFLNFLVNNPYVETLWLQQVSESFTPSFQELIQTLFAESKALSSSQSSAG